MHKNISKSLLPKPLSDIIKIWEIEKYEDPRGFSFEAFRADRTCPGPNEISMVYYALNKPNYTRGPHEHLNHNVYILFTGDAIFDVNFWLNDTKAGEKVKLKDLHSAGFLTRPEPLLVYVPTKVIHSYKNIASKSGTTITISQDLYKGINKRENEDTVRYEDQLV